jgi:hypothetical protein
MAKKGHLPLIPEGIMAQDIDITVIAQYLEIAMVRRQPSIQDLIHNDASRGYPEAPRRLFSTISAVAFHLNLVNHVTS